MNIADFFGHILTILLVAYAIAATAVLLIFFPKAPQMIRWWIKATAGRVWRRIGRWWDKQGWRVIHLFWLTLGTVALWLSVWGIYIIFFWNENER